MKVGILSMQRIKNYGSFLQAYGLKMIMENLGVEVKFVDYHPGNLLISTNDSKGFKRKILNLILVFLEEKGSRFLLNVLNMRSMWLWAKLRFIIIELVIQIVVLPSLG